MNVGVLLAAGSGKRMGGLKPLAKAGRESFLVRGIRMLWTACDVVIVVIGADAAKIRKESEKELEARVIAGGFHHLVANTKKKGGRTLEVHFVVNRTWRKGMLTSVKAGLSAARGLKPSTVFVLPVDHPEITGRTVSDLAEVLQQALEACRNPRERAAFSYALVPRWRRKRGHPVALTPALAWAVATDSDCENLSDGIRRNARLVGYLDVEDPGVLVNQNGSKR
jgi:CTP:molybdopterin cytidylyltransferase MocA